jgi:hypothetical protein
VRRRGALSEGVAGGLDGGQHGADIVVVVVDGHEALDEAVRQRWESIAEASTSPRATSPIERSWKPAWTTRP